MKKIKNIPTLGDDGFKLVMAYYDPEEYSKKNINDFYIHGLSDNTYKIKIPLPPHRQHLHSIILVTQGSIVAGSGTDNYTIGNNTMIVVPAGQITSLSFMSGDIQGFYLHFSNDYLSGTSVDFSEWLIWPVIKFEVAESEHLVALLRRMQKLNEHEGSASLIKLYLATFLAEISQSAAFIPRMNFAAHERITMQFKRLISEQINKNNSVRFYATKLSITPNHLNKSVNATLGRSASTLIVVMLILEIKVLMQKSNMAISEIAFETGFEDTSYFGRFFKKHTSCSPTEYRKMIELSE